MNDSSDTLLIISGQLPSILTAIVIGWYVMGFGLAGLGLWRAATAGNSRGGGSHTMTGGIGMFIFGSLMLNLIGTVSSVFATFYGAGASPEFVLSAVPHTDDRMQMWVTVIMNVLVVIGWYAAGKGLFNLATAKSRQDGGFGSGVAHLIAAAALCNPQLFAYSIGATFGANDAVSLLIPPPPN